MNKNYSNTQINKAGNIIKDKESFILDEIEQAENILTHLRFIHSNVLYTFQGWMRMILKRSFNDKGFIAQRLKRIPSIVAKLNRNPNMKLSTMQDIAGVRVVLQNKNDIDAFLQKIDSSKAEHKLIKKDDYIENPKESGYRSVHLIYECKNKTNNDGLKVEIQIRTKLQHIWATSVETMGTFINMSLKSSEGDKEILEFFSLVSSAFAFIEKSNQLPQYKDALEEYIYGKVISEYRRLNIEDKLLAFRIVAKKIDKSAKNKYFLIILDLTKKIVTTIPYTKLQLEQAHIDYTLNEKRLQNGENIQVVLVSIDSINTLKKAYPNYFLDTKDFIGKINNIKGKLIRYE